MEPTLLVLAAGMGSRYGGLKQADQVGPDGETIIDYSIYDAIRAGFTQVVLVVRANILEEMKAIFDDRWGKLVHISYSIQEVNVPVAGIDQLPVRQKPWGTAHAVMVAKDNIDGPFAVINADDFYGAEAFQSLYSFLKDNPDPGEYAMVGYILKNTLSEHGFVSRGITTSDKNKCLTSIIERTHIERLPDGRVVFTDANSILQELDEESFVSMNCWAFPNSFFTEAEHLFRTFVTTNQDPQKSEFYIPTVVEHLMEQEKVRVKVLECGAQWMGITYREDKSVVAKKVDGYINDGIYPPSLWNSLLSSRS